MELISNCTADVISNAAKALIDGHLVAFPTETVYGLGADGTNEKAVSRIYSVKGRPVGHPLIVHISSINKLEDWATNIPDYAIKLAREFWPGPLTLILPRTDLAKDYITGGQNNVGLRIPAQPVALALLKKFEELGGQGIVAPSANRFGAVSPTTAEAVSEVLGDRLDPDDLLLDGGQCSVGIESTIIDCTSDRPIILRPGSVTIKNLKDVLNIDINGFKSLSKIKHSGQLPKHYSPKAEVLLNVKAKPSEGFLAMSNLPTPDGAIRLAAPRTIEEYAHQLYEAFRLADKKRLKKIVAITPVGDGIAAAITDRLMRAESKKSNIGT
jgi:L-threonylcarbamoyladenylate synthase